ncbi:MAG: hypothetical protein WD767_20055 [Alphaproteobacteria bacterium]
MKFGSDCALKESLSEALRLAVSDYAAFAATPVPAKADDNGAGIAIDARDLAARHAAGKTMVGHIAALAKLVHWWSAAGADTPADGGGAGPDMMAAARDAVSRYAADEE